MNMLLTLDSNFLWENLLKKNCWRSAADCEYAANFHDVKHEIHAHIVIGYASYELKLTG